MNTLFKNKIICCGGLADFFNIGIRKNGTIKDFDFCIKISDFIEVLSLTDEIVANILDTTFIFNMEFYGLKLIKYPNFLPDHIVCLQGYLKKDKRIYAIDLFIIDDNDNVEYIQTIKNDLVFNVEAPIYRIKALDFLINLDSSEYKPNRKSGIEWLEEKKESFKKRQQLYKDRYPELFDTKKEKFKEQG
jgi:hypothetical protein